MIYEIELKLSCRRLKAGEHDGPFEPFILYADGLERACALSSLLEKISTPEVSYDVLDISSEQLNKEDYETEKK